MPSLRLSHALPLLLTLLPPTLAHGTHAPANPSFHDGTQAILDADAPAPADWPSLHMRSEHHIAHYDARTFFTLHDYDADGLWEPGEILRTYGCAPASTNGLGGPGAALPDGGRVPEHLQDALLADVRARFDADGDGVVSAAEWEGAWARGERLQDWGWGPGHHGDDEWEYEVHHFEAFHDENTTEEELTHPEDIAHFRAHEAMEEREERLRGMVGRVEERNIPGKFRRA